MKITRDKNPLLFFSKSEKKLIEEAVRVAELRTSAEIRVHLERRAREPFLEHAKKVFETIGMTATQERNGVLIFIGIASRRFAVLGDMGIDAKVPSGFWGRATGLMSDEFQKDRFAEGISKAVMLIGEQLAGHFPRNADDINELSDCISFSI